MYIVTRLSGGFVFKKQYLNYICIVGIENIKKVLLTVNNCATIIETSKEKRVKLNTMM